MRYTQTTFVFVLQPCSEKRYAVSACGRFPYLQDTAVRYGVLTVGLLVFPKWRNEVAGKQLHVFPVVPNQLLKIRIPN